MTVEAELIESRRRVHIGAGLRSRARVTEVPVFRGNDKETPTSDVNAEVKVVLYREG